MKRTDPFAGLEPEDESGLIEDSGIPETNQEIPRQQAQWPGPAAEEAFHGLAGEIVKVIEPHSEGGSRGVAGAASGYFGNIIDRSAHFMAKVIVMQ